MLEPITTVGLATIRWRCLLKEKSFYLWLLCKVIPSYALSVPWLSSASLFYVLGTSKYFCADSPDSREFGGLIIFLMISQSKVLSSLGSEKSSLQNLFFFSPLFDLPLHLPQPDPRRWLSFPESTACSLAHSCLALVTPVLFHSLPSYFGWYSVKFFLRS